MKQQSSRCRASFELIVDQALEPRCSSTIINQIRAHGVLMLARERTRSFSRPPLSGGIGSRQQKSGCARLGGEVGPPLGVVVKRSFSRFRRLSSSSSFHVRVGSIKRPISAEPKKQTVTKKNTPSCGSTKAAYRSPKFEPMGNIEINSKIPKTHVRQWTTVHGSGEFPRHL